MTELSRQQRAVIELGGDVFVTACPGSGKTRVLTEKIIATLEHGIPSCQRIAAVTFTNRAADEIASRLQESGYSRRQLWTGTIHSFALDWILRPYASYDESISRGFSVADEFHCRRLLESLRENHGVQYTDNLRKGYDRDGELLTKDVNERRLIEEFREHLGANRLIDFDRVLYLAFNLLQRRPEIAKTLGAIFSLVCIDEYQDTQDLQFGILSSIVRASNERSRVFIVGDKNQAIYSSLGGMAKTIQEVKDEFARPQLLHRELSGNYRSTQRIVDFCANMCETGEEPITSLASHADEQGIITFANQSIDKDDLAQSIAQLVEYHLGCGVNAEDICILGPSWALLTALGRQLVLHLPNVDLDAPGLSPLRYQPDSLWFRLARLFLTDPTPSRFRTRFRWATDFVLNLEECLGKELPESCRTARSILRLTNIIASVEESGLAYLDDVFEQFFAGLEIDLNEYPEILAARQSFFDGAEERLINRESELESIDNLKKMFRHPSGIVVNSCHGAKGEEYAVVICFGLLRGFVPNWQRIIDNDVDDCAESKRILYVIASRAKKCIHLFSENGRVTRRQQAYETTYELTEFEFDYDGHPE